MIVEDCGGLWSISARDKNNDRSSHKPRFILPRTVAHERPRGLTAYSAAK